MQFKIWNFLVFDQKNRRNNYLKNDSLIMPWMITKSHLNFLFLAFTSMFGQMCSCQETQPTILAIVLLSLRLVSAKVLLNCRFSVKYSHAQCTLELITFIQLSIWISIRTWFNISGSSFDVSSTTCRIQFVAFLLKVKCHIQIIHAC